MWRSFIRTGDTAGHCHARELRLDPQTRSSAVVTAYDTSVSWSLLAAASSRA
jgi:hypothetical protein